MSEGRLICDLCQLETHQCPDDTVEDVESGAIFQSPLSLDDIKEITGMTRQLQGRELYKFATDLRSRTEPIKLIVDVNTSEVSAESIMKEEV